MRVMALSAMHMFFFPVPVTCPLAVNSHLPLPVDFPMALFTYFVIFIIFNKLAVYETQFVPVLCAVAVKAPPVVCIMV